MTKEELITRIKKLLALSDSSNPNEAAICKTKIKSGEIIGLDGIIDCNTPDIDNLISKLKGIREELQISPKVEVIKGNLIQ